MTRQLGDDPHSRLVWPPPEAASLLAVRSEYDTRDGWVRVVWEPGKAPHREGTADAQALLPADLSDRHAVLAQVRSWGWPRVRTSGPGWE